MLNFILNSILNYFKNTNNEFYYLSLLNDNNKWHIHGLWPQYSINSYPKFCKQVKFDINELKDIYSDLNKYWYSNKNTEDQTDEKAQEFASLMKESVQAVTTKVTGPNPNLPKIQSKAWTDTSYPDYNYILTTI